MLQMTLHLTRSNRLWTFQLRVFEGLQKNPLQHEETFYLKKQNLEDFIVLIFKYVVFFNASKVEIKFCR
jgi:hypothetical protein